MYLGIRQYELHFDLPGFGILCGAVLALGALAWQMYRRKPAASSVAFVVLLSLCSIQAYRGWMVPNSTWLAMLGAIEQASEQERGRKIQELSQYWRNETMRAADWYKLANHWNVCHTFWEQTDCRNPVSTETAVGVAREILNDLAASNYYSYGAR